MQNSRCLKETFDSLPNMWNPVTIMWGEKRKKKKRVISRIWTNSFNGFINLTLWALGGVIRPVNGRALCTTCDVIRLSGGKLTTTPQVLWCSFNSPLFVVPIRGYLKSRDLVEMQNYGAYEVEGRYLVFHVLPRWQLLIDSLATALEGWRKLPCIFQSSRWRKCFWTRTQQARMFAR